MKNQKGETLIEAILALTMVIVIITGVVTAVIAALNGASSNKNQTTALNFAQEGMDELRDDKSSNFTAFSAAYSAPGYYCFGQDNTPTGVSNCPDTGSNIGSGNLFVRKVYVDLTGHSPDGALKCNSGVYVISLVSWSDGKCSPDVDCHKVGIDSCFYNLNSLTAP
jgi:type II secretory pathway pseudopilin PulG